MDARTVPSIDDLKRRRARSVGRALERQQRRSHGLGRGRRGSVGRGLVGSPDSCFLQFVPAPRSYPPGTRTRPRSYAQKSRELLVRYSFLVCSDSFATVFLLVRYSCLVVFVLVHGRVQKTRTRPWTSTGQVRLRARTSTASARCRRLPEVELAPELELVRGLSPASPRSSLKFSASSTSALFFAIPIRRG